MAEIETLAIQIRDSFDVRGAASPAIPQQMPVSIVPTPPSGCLLLIAGQSAPPAFHNIIVMFMHSVAQTARRLIHFKRHSDISNSHRSPPFPQVLTLDLSCVSDTGNDMSSYQKLWHQLNYVLWNCGHTFLATLPALPELLSLFFFLFLGSSRYLLPKPELAIFLGSIVCSSQRKQCDDG